MSATSSGTTQSRTTAPQAQRAQAPRAQAQCAQAQRAQANVPMPPQARAPMVIVGAGECGARAAVSLRRRGWTDGILLLGEEPGLPYERPPVSKKVLLHGTSAPAVFTADDFATIDRRPDTVVTALDPIARTVQLATGETVQYSAALLATGARARPLQQADGLGNRVFTVRTEADALRLRNQLTPGARLVVIGGGFIGLEAAAAARTLGASVVVLEQAPHLMARALPTALADVVGRRHEEEGVRVITGAQVRALTPVGDSGVEVSLADGERLIADVLVVGVGAQPRVELAEAAGLTVDDGIVVDAGLATSAPGVLAAGDCCRFPHRLAEGLVRLESWRSAVRQGEHAAGNLIAWAQGRVSEPFEDVPWLWSDQYDLTLRTAGLAHTVTTEVVRQRPDGALLWFGLDTGGVLVAVAGVGRDNSVVQDLTAGERLVGRSARPDPAALADPEVELRALLRR